MTLNYFSKHCNSSCIMIFCTLKKKENIYTYIERGSEEEQNLIATIIDTCFQYLH